MAPTGCPETSVRNYHYTLRKTHKSPDLIYIAVGAWNPIPLFPFRLRQLIHCHIIETYFLQKKKKKPKHKYNP